LADGADARCRREPRIDALNHWARFVPAEGKSAMDPSLSITTNMLQPGHGCAYFQFALRRTDNGELLEDVRRLLASAEGATCDAIIGYGAILAAFERGLAGGSWLWTVAAE
jgi:hypothetical protein